MKLYSYWRSTAPCRVRIALNLKGIAWKAVPVSLLANEQNAPGYAVLNLGQGVPTLLHRADRPENQPDTT